MESKGSSAFIARKGCQAKVELVAEMRLFATSGGHAVVLCQSLLFEGSGSSLLLVQVNCPLSALFFKERR
jgi:hypothetical protein